MDIRNLLKDIDLASRPDNPLLFDFSEPSESAKFYAKQFTACNLEKPKQADAEKPVPAEMVSIMNFLTKQLPFDSVVVELGGSWHQNRSGYPSMKFPNYLPLDISHSSMTNYTILYERPAVVANAEKLPFKDQSIDAVFTHTFLEHPVHPEKVLSEIVRVLKPGGIVVHCDAWHCRWWQRYGIVGVKKISQMTVKEKLIFLMAKITEMKIIRMPLIIIRRVAAETVKSTRKPVSLLYKRLNPNYDLHLYFDEDAASSIDPLHVIRFYESRGFSLVEKKSFFQRIFYRDIDIRLRKSI